MPNPSTIAEAEQTLDPRIPADAPIMVTIARGPLVGQIMIDPFMFDHASDPTALIAAPATAFIKEMIRG